LSGFVVNPYQILKVFAGGFASATKVTNGAEAEEDISSGGSDRRATLMGGKQFVDSGGVASGTKIASGSIQFVRGIANSATIQNDGDQAIGSGGTALNTTLTSGGRQDIAAMILGAGTAISTTMSGGGIQEVHAGGIASDTIVRGGYQQVDAGGSAFDSIITSKGLTFIEAGASGVDAIVGSGGTMKVAGEARDPIISGGLLDLVEGYSTDGILGFASEVDCSTDRRKGSRHNHAESLFVLYWNFEARRPVLFQQIPSH
jgi:autotransporter passenger strand-loop-strand repeat protein